MVTEEQATQFVEKLTALIEENKESNQVMVKKSYAQSFENAKTSMENRIAHGEFPTLAALRKKFQDLPI